jgi:hypothetical protein
VLKRHILPKLNSSDLMLNFSFCERESVGEIKNSEGKVLGEFYLLYEE